MSDIFQEVEEEVRRERFEQIWKQYGDYIIAGVALVVIAVAGWQLWQRYEASQRLKASEQLIAAQQLADSGNLAKATPALAVLAKDAPNGYAKLAKLSQAGSLLAAGQRAAAIEIYKGVAADDSGPLGRAALVRAAWAMADTSPRADVEALLAPLNDAASPWRHNAREILAYADFHAGDTKKAAAEFKALSDDKDAPESMRRRAEAMAAFLNNGGMATFGTVPPPPAPAGTAPAAPTAGATPTPPAPPAPTPAPPPGTPPK
ncbi:MAG: tetratricopeptide repeat protein [Alphaproteobacteria bacterium]|nr:tetratricopeptide repeat protein [Alphaproteobacteria bacterium]